MVLACGRRLARSGWRLRRREYPRRRRIRQGVARGWQARTQAERLRRFHRRGQLPRPREIHDVVAPCDRGRLKRRPAGRGDDDPAAGTVRRGVAPGRGSRHDAVPQVLGGTILDGRLRLVGRREGSAIPDGLLASAQPEGRHLLPGHAHHDCRPRRPCRAEPLVQVRSRAAGCPGLREADIDPHRSGGSHGYRPTDRIIAEAADMWAFALANMQVGN